MCGRPVVLAARPLSASPDISAIDNRLEQLQGINLSSAYVKQKASLKREFSAFLRSLSGNKTFSEHRQKADDHTQVRQLGNHRSSSNPLLVSLLKCFSRWSGPQGFSD